MLFGIIDFGFKRRILSAKLTKKIISSLVPFCSIKRNKLDKKREQARRGTPKNNTGLEGIHKLKIIQAID